MLPPPPTIPPCPEWDSVVGGRGDPCGKRVVGGVPTSLLVGPDGGEVEAAVVAEVAVCGVLFFVWA